MRLIFQRPARSQLTFCSKLFQGYWKRFRAIFGYLVGVEDERRGLALRGGPRFWDWQRKWRCNFVQKRIKNCVLVFWPVAQNYLHEVCLQVTGHDHPILLGASQAVVLMLMIAQASEYFWLVLIAIAIAFASMIFIVDPAEKLFSNRGRR